jgi:hypothetical protein
MHANWEQFEKECAQHELVRDLSAPLNGPIRYSKPGLSVETINCEEFRVTHGETSQQCHGRASLASLLGEIDPL